MGEVERRLLRRLDPRGELAEVACAGVGARRPGGVLLRLLGAAEVPPRAVDGRQLSRIPLREHQVQVDDAEVVCERADPVFRGRVARLRRVRAELLRAQVREPLDDLEVVAAAEEREQVLRMVAQDRKLVGLRELPVEDRRDRVLGVRMDGRRVPEPRRVAGERREVRPARAVDPCSSGPSATPSRTRRRRRGRRGSSTSRPRSSPAPRRPR